LICYHYEILENSSLICYYYDIYIYYLCPVRCSLLKFIYVDFWSQENTNSRRLEISSPFEFKHTVHVGFVPETGEFTVWLFDYLLFVNLRIMTTCVTFLLRLFALSCILLSTIRG
jgi:hypothetical protein